LSQVRRGRLVPYLLSLPGLTWLLIFFAIPVATLGSLSLQEGSLERGYALTWRWSNYTEAFAKYDTQLYRSLLYGLIVTVATLIISFPMSYWIATKAGRRKNVFLLLILLPFFTPFVIRTLSWKFILADEGITLGFLKDLGILSEGFQVLATPVAVVCGLIYNFLPFMALPLYVALERLDPSLLDAAYDLYSSKVQVFWRVIFPLSLPGVFAGSLLVFIPSVGDFINAELLGGVNTTMIGNVIQRELLTTNDYPEGAALSILLMAGILVGVALYVRAVGSEEALG
jgi:spermidine/putrescine transport system permease protein